MLRPINQPVSYFHYSKVYLITKELNTVVSISIFLNGPLSLFNREIVQEYEEVEQVIRIYEIETS